MQKNEHKDDGILSNTATRLTSRIVAMRLRHLADGLERIELSSHAVASVMHDMADDIVQVSEIIERFE